MLFRFLVMNIGFYCILKELTSRLEMPENAVKHSNPNIIRSFKPSIQLSN